MNGEMIRNGFGYVDPTPYQAINEAPKGGEIWTRGNGAEVLILKNHGSICTVIMLTNIAKPESVEVTSCQIMYADLRFVQYAFSKDLAQYVKTLPVPEYKAIMEAFAEAMGFAASPQSADRAEYIAELEAALDHQNDAIAMMEQEFDHVSDMLQSYKKLYLDYRAFYEAWMEGKRYKQGDGR